MQTQAQRALAYDRYLEVPDMPEWSDSDINEAIEGLEDDIINNNRVWDEDNDYRVNYALEIERILLNEPKDEQLALIRDAFNKNVHNYCVSEVNRNPDFYCAKYCDTEF